MSDALFNRLFKKMKNTNVGHLEVGVKTLSQAQPGENASPWEGYTSTFLTFSFSVILFLSEQQTGICW